MGMAASQARYLGLTARKTNVEYEGQQVNQERTALANQSAGLFNQMLSLNVPTPPSANDYTKTEYVFTDNSTSQKYTIDSIYRNPTPDEDGNYLYTISTYRSTTDVLSNRSEIVSSGTSSNRFTISRGDDDTYTIQIGHNTSHTIIEPQQYTALTSKFQEADEKAGITDSQIIPYYTDAYRTFTVKMASMYSNGNPLIPSSFPKDRLKDNCLNSDNINYSSAKNCTVLIFYDGWEMKY